MVNRWFLIASVLVSVWMVFGMVRPTHAQIPPPFPTVLSGQVFVGGDVAPEGLGIFAKVLSYETRHVTVDANGMYDTLVVGPPTAVYQKRPIVIYATFGYGTVVAAEGETFSGVPRFVELDLHFPSLPVGPTPVPAPTVTPTPVPTPTALLPLPGDPVVGNMAILVLMLGPVLLLMGLFVVRMAVRRRGL